MLNLHSMCDNLKPALPSQLNPYSHFWFFGLSFLVFCSLGFAKVSMADEEETKSMISTTVAESSTIITTKKTNSFALDQLVIQEERQNIDLGFRSTSSSILSREERKAEDGKLKLQIDGKVEYDNMKLRLKKDEVEFTFTRPLGL